MADTGASINAVQDTPAKSFLSRLIGIFIEPGETFEDIARKPDFIAPLVLLILVSFAVAEAMIMKIGIYRIIMQSLTLGGQAAKMDPEQLNTVVQRSAAIYSKVIPIIALLGTPVFLLIAAGFGILVLNVFFAQRASFKQVFSVTCYANLPSIVGAVMAGMVMFYGDPDSFNPRNVAPTNPGYFMNPLTSSHALLAVASSLDVIVLWFLVLLAMGLARVSQNKVKAGSIFLTYLGVWALLVIAKVAMAVFFG